jgi:DNA-directed RNA polymerase alpha subunit
MDRNLAEQALALKDSGKRYEEIGRILGFVVPPQSTSRNHIALKVGRLVNYAKRLREMREKFGDYLTDGINNDTPFTRIEMSVRLANVLKYEYIHTIGQARLKTDEELLRIPNFGKTSLAELHRIIATASTNTTLCQQYKQTLTTRF